MSAVNFPPPFTTPDAVAGELRERGFALLAPGDVARVVGCDLAALQALNGDWAALPPDDYLRDGGRYRRRRHACFVVQGAQIEAVAQRAHWQPPEYNALHGGMERWFAPMLAATAARPVWPQLLAALARMADALFAAGAGAQRWFTEAHQFRIDTTDGIGRPTPEGAHRDGVDLVAVFLVGRERVKGGETRVFEAAGSSGQRFTLTQPWSLMLLDDARMIHETTPILPLAAPAGPPAANPAPQRQPDGYRDTLVVTCRRGGFQQAGAAQPAGR